VTRPATVVDDGAAGTTPDGSGTRSRVNYFTAKESRARVPA
jgi:hypothetical protein